MLIFPAGSKNPLYTIGSSFLVSLSKPELHGCPVTQIAACEKHIVVLLWQGHTALLAELSKVVKKDKRSLGRRKVPK